MCMCMSKRREPGKKVKDERGNIERGKEKIVGPKKNIHSNREKRKDKKFQRGMVEFGGLVSRFD